MTSPAGTLLWLIVLAFSWGSQWPVMKAVLNVVDPIEARAVGVTAAGLLLFGVCRASGQPLRVARQHWRLLLVAAFFNITCWTWAPRRSAHC